MPRRCLPRLLRAHGPARTQRADAESLRAGGAAVDGDAPECRRATGSATARGSGARTRREPKSRRRSSSGANEERRSGRSERPAARSRWTRGSRTWTSSTRCGCAVSWTAGDTAAATRCSVSYPPRKPRMRTTDISGSDNRFPFRCVSTACRAIAWSTSRSSCSASTSTRPPSMPPSVQESSSALSATSRSTLWCASPPSSRQSRRLLPDGRPAPPAPRGSRSCLRMCSRTPCWASWTSSSSWARAQSAAACSGQQSAARARG